MRTPLQRLMRLIEHERHLNEQATEDAAVRATAQEIERYRKEHPDAKPAKVQAHARQYATRLWAFCERMTK